MLQAQGRNYEGDDYLRQSEELRDRLSYWDERKENILIPEYDFKFWQVDIFIHMRGERIQYLYERREIKLREIEWWVLKKGREESLGKEEVDKSWIILSLI